MGYHQCVLFFLRRLLKTRSVSTQPIFTMSLFLGTMSLSTSMGTMFPSTSCKTNALCFTSQFGEQCPFPPLWERLKQSLSIKEGFGINLWLIQDCYLQFYDLSSWPKNVSSTMYSRLLTKKYWQGINELSIVIMDSGRVSTGYQQYKGLMRVSLMKH